jgi:DNA-binding transcriptional LysR family regulator
LADQYGKELAFGPDHNFAQEYGPAVAPYVDIFVLQVQRVQTEPQTVRQFVVPLVAELRRANPELEISVQLRTEGDTKALADLLLSLDGAVDGVSILTNDDTAAVADQLLAELRTPVAELPTPRPEGSRPAPTQNEAQAAVVETPTPATRRSGAATPQPVSGATALPSEPGMPARTLLLVSSLTVMGIILGGVVTTVLLYTVKRGKRR